MLVNDTPPSGSVDVLVAELTEAADDGRLSAYLDQSAEVDALTVTAPHPYFVLDVEDLPHDDTVPFPGRYAGWRYLLEVNGRVVALVTTSFDEVTGVHSFGGVGTGPAVSSVVFAVHIADGLLRDRSDDYTMAALDYPALHLVLLRVCSKAGNERAYLPIGLATALHPAQLHPRAEVRRALRRMAARVGNEPSDDEPIGG
jgi:hypothetical protein